MSKLSTHWHLFWQFRKLQLMVTTEYRGNFIFWAVVSTMWTIFNFFFFDVITTTRGSLGGWTPPEMRLFLAVFTMIDAFLWSFIHNNMRFYTRAIFSGELSRFLVMPIDTQYLLMVNDNDYTNIFRFALGLVIMIQALVQLQIQVSLLSVFLATLLIICGGLFIYFLWFFICTWAFWVEKLDNINEVVPSLRSIWQVPRQVFRGLMSTIVTVVLPIALINTLPSEILLGRVNYYLVLYFIGATIATFIVSRWFFHYSVKRFIGSAN